jgi:hypothetical protein
MSNATLEKVQYVSDQNGNLTGVFLPIEVWRDIEADILQSDVMRERLLEARKRDEGIPFEEALEKLGV